ncbi:MAG: replicative DNA helicase [Sediminibacterium sp.]|nr:replicative DNA helicase [Sediminibacterium sp.]
MDPKTNFISTSQQRQSFLSPEDMSGLSQGKIAPQSVEIEEAVLGAIMLENSAFELVDDKLKPECFYLPAHRHIYETIFQLNKESQPVDYLTVIERLKKNGTLDKAGGTYNVAKLTGNVISAAHIEAHANIILEKFIQRELIRISGEIIKTSYEDTTDVFDLLDMSETKIFEIANKYLKKNFSRMDQAVAEAILRIENLSKKNNSNDVSGVPSGFELLDLVTNGWQPTDLLILAARPGVGKTAFALNLAINAAVHKVKPTAVGFFSMEMSISQLVNRMLSCLSEVKMEKINRGNYEKWEMQQIIEKGAKVLSTAPIFLDDSSALNIFEFRAKARRMVEKHQVGLIIIDYLQLMNGTSNRNSNREQEISTISRNLKALAKELNVPIIALSQLSRDVEKRGDKHKIPQLSDLRESGAIEQDADIVLFLYREDYYQNSKGNNQEILDDDDEKDKNGKVLLRIAKHRNGKLADFDLRFLNEIQRYEDFNTKNYQATSISSINRESLANRNYSNSNPSFAQNDNLNSIKLNPTNLNGIENNEDPFEH